GSGRRVLGFALGSLPRPAFRRPGSDTLAPTPAVHAGAWSVPPGAHPPDGLRSVAAGPLSKRPQSDHKLRLFAATATRTVTHHQEWAARSLCNLQGRGAEACLTLRMITMGRACRNHLDPGLAHPQSAVHRGPGTNELSSATEESIGHR